MKKTMKCFIALVLCFCAFYTFGADADKYRKAAEDGDVNAQYNLGSCYENGEGVAKDQVEAVKWFYKAAEQGHPEAQYNLGLCYEFGKGVTADLAEAVKWFRKAAEQGHENAIRNLSWREK